MVRVETTGLLLGLISSTVAAPNPIPFSPGFDIERVIALTNSSQAHSWEYGTAAQAFLELYDPQHAVFGDTPFPVPTLARSNVRSLAYAATKIILGGDQKDGLSNGNGAVGDPLSLGVSAILLGKADPVFNVATRESIRFMTVTAPRFWNGAISHRADIKELWADFMYMAPPFLAYYAADKGDDAMLHDSVKQCGYYREVLQAKTPKTCKGAWHHIIGPESQDLGLWSTGNAWAAAGMTRVLATVIKAPTAQYSNWRQEAIDSLTTWIKEILDGAMSAPMDGGLLRNYLDNMDSSRHGFGEISGSSLLAAVAYRMAVLRPQVFGERYIEWAEGIRLVLGGRDKNGNPHVTSTGVVTPAVNPLWWLDPKPLTTGSPEGQSFVVLMYAAWRDCVLAGTCRWKGGLQKKRSLHRANGHRHLV